MALPRLEPVPLGKEIEAPDRHSGSGGLCHHNLPLLSRKIVGREPIVSDFQTEEAVATFSLRLTRCFERSCKKMRPQAETPAASLLWISMRNNEHAEGLKSSSPALAC